MISTYVLIILSVYNGHRPVDVPFDSKASCEYAASEINKHVSNYSKSSKAFCFKR